MNYHNFFEKFQVNGYCYLNMVVQNEFCIYLEYIWKGFFKKHILTPIAMIKNILSTCLLYLILIYITIYSFLNLDTTSRINQIKLID